MPTVVTIDAKAIEKLGDEFDAAARAAIIRLLERGEQLLIQEMPERTGLLKGKKGNNSVSSDYRKTEQSYQGEIAVSAIRERRNEQGATLHLPSGATKKVSLRPQPAFDYAEAVARGRKEIRPRQAKALLIPVESVPAGQSYIEAGGEKFIIRPRAKATKPNPYDQRAGARLEKEAEGIFDKTLAEFGLLK